jgi:sulfatase maturation enzyme AslB (radical SAM superfamily)
MDNKRPACYAPWITTYEYPGKIVPCCEWNGYSGRSIDAEEHVSLDDRFNHPITESIKEELMAGVLPPECKNCVKMEENTNQMSVRQQYNGIVKRAEKSTDYEWNVDEFTLLNMDYRESNLCNFSCMMCGYPLSSVHAQIDGKYGKTGIKKNPHNLQMYLDRLDEVQLIQCLGGEPLLTESMWTTIKEVKRRGLEGQINLSITTNGSLLHRHDDELLELVEGFKDVMIAVSIDCVGVQHDYWRSSNSWETVKTNVDKIYKWSEGKMSNKMFCTRTAIGWPNAYAARDVFDMFTDWDMRRRWNLITGPIGLSLPMLPQEDLEKLAEHWKDYPDVSEMFANTVSSPDVFQMQQQRKQIEKLEKLRDIKFKDAFPEMAHIYNKSNN